VYAKPEPSSTNRTRYYVESTDAHPLPIIKLGTSTAHIYCLRIIDDGVFNLAMTEQHLDGAQISAGFEQVRGVTVSQRVWRDMLPDPRALRCLSASFPRNLGGDGNVRSPILQRAGKQIVLRLHPTPIDTERVQKFFAQGNITVMSAFPLADVNHHPLAVDIGDLKTAQFRATDTR